jgi:hypothetical protein
MDYVQHIQNLIFYNKFISCILIAKHLRGPNTTIILMLIGIKIKKTRKVLGP